ncbi:HAD-IA family hydrolase [Candidatus Saccharibacteria bacterium]|nr:HAD-IA family hydrolase [Candidatus Saccharibacteria bacterium]
MKDVILFDLDGTITDSKVGITKSVQYALRYFGINVDDPDELCKFIGPPLRQSFKDFYDFDDAGAERAVEKWREYFLEKGIFENILYSGIDVMLKKLKRGGGKTLLVASTKSTSSAEKVLEYLCISEYFTFVSGSELNGDRSDKKELILYALENADIKDISRCIMVGDRKHDIIGAKSVGMDSVGVLYGYGNYKELLEAGATHIVRDVEGLSELLLNF